MGLLDSVIGALGQGAGGGQNNPQAALVSAIIGMLTQGGGAGGGGAGGGLGGMLGSALGAGAGGAGAGAGGLGGLAGLVEQFSRHGMGDIAKSWVGTGQNMPVSPDQLSQVLGGDRLGQMSRQLGMDHGDLLGQLSQMLPQVVDQLTPQGSIPQGDVHGMGGADLGNLLGSLQAGGRR
ncbi:MAG: YidB family protein [Rubrivivax sp.]